MKGKGFKRHTVQYQTTMLFGKEFYDNINQFDLRY